MNNNVVRSRDETRIFFQTSGSGPPLVLLHGGGSSRRRWKPLLPYLEDHVTVHAVDRRGRGESEDGNAYAIEREFEDVAAVVDAVGPEVNLLGISYGGLCAMEAALLTNHVHKLILYEPPFATAKTSLVPAGSIDRLERLLDEGDREGVVSTLMREVARLPDHEFELWKTTPSYREQVKAAHTIPREVRAAEEYKFEPERFQNLNVPTLLLLGADSPELVRGGTEALDAALPDSQVAILSGEGHIAMDSAPELFAKEVLNFVLSYYGD